MSGFDFSLEPDVTGFPLLRVQSLGFSASLWPLTKMQFEILCVAAPQEKLRAFGDGDINSWYEEVLAESPRLFWKSQIWGSQLGSAKASSQQVAKVESSVWLTGLDACEVEPIISLFGEQFRVPTAEEWRDLNHALEKTPLSQMQLRKLVHTQEWHHGAAHFFDQISKDKSLTVWNQIALSGNGLAEVALKCDDIFENSQFIGLGRVKGTLWNSKQGVTYPLERRDARFGIRPFQSIP